MDALLSLTTPFTLADAAALGVSRQQLRTLVAARAVRRLATGWYRVHRNLLDDDAAQLHMAFAMAPRGAVLTGAAAARLHGIAVPNAEKVSRVQFLLPSDAAPVTRDTKLLHVASRPIPREHIIERAGRLMTSAPWTAMELALGESLPFALIAFDSAMRLGITRAQLHALVPDFASRRGSSGIAPCIDEATPLAESALESRSRGHFLELGLPRPELQVEVRLATGRTVRVDFAWRLANLAGEADGLMKYPNAQPYRMEKIREMEIRRRGIDVERWTQWDLDHGLDALAQRLAQYMDR